LSLKEIEMAKRERDVEKAQYWRLVLEEFGASGLNVREFCRKEGLREPSFYAWRRELHQRDGVATSSGDVNGTGLIYKRIRPFTSSSWFSPWRARLV
jgi:transposase-like protein